MTCALMSGAASPTNSGDGSEPKTGVEKMANKNVATATGNEPKKARKARSNDRRNALKVIRETAKASISEKYPNNRYIGFAFSFTDSGQGTVFVYHIDTNKPESVQIIRFTSPAMLNAALIAGK